MHADNEQSAAEGQPPAAADARWSTTVSVLFTAALLAVMTNWLAGAPFWIAAVIACVLAFVAFGELAALLFPSAGQRLRKRFHSVALILFGLGLAVIATETFFAWREWRGRIVASEAQPQATAESSAEERQISAAESYGAPLKAAAAAEVRRRAPFLTMPPEWELKKQDLAGSVYTYLWHGYLHVHDENWFRRTTAFPPKSANKLRIMLVGDSMTYGYGIDEKFIYATLLQEALEKDYKVEVLNLGRSGWQSEDILKILRDFLPRLQPDLVVYGVVHNDFLNSQQGQYDTRGWKFPLPEDWQKYLLKRSRFARFLSDSYDATLRSVGLRNDFFADILSDFDGYQKRFARDVRAMNELVTGAGLPPIIATVLDQFPARGGRGHQISMAAERYLGEAGMQVISTNDYYARFDGYAMGVSPWEGHSNEVAHAIFGVDPLDTSTANAYIPLSK